MQKQETICFIDNYDRTPIFEKVSQHFKKENVFWITLNSKINHHLLKKFKKKNILYLNYKTKNKSNNFIKENKLNEVFLSDRILRNKGYIGYKFLENIEGNIYDFINLNSIKVVIGEFTWGHELLVNRIIKNNNLDCKYFNLQPLRYPFNRSGFFINESQDEIIKINKEVKNNLDFSDDNYSKNEREKSKISFTNITNLFLKIFKKDHYNNQDILYISKFSKVKQNIKILLNTIDYLKLKKNKSLLKNNNFKILFALQKQPEASADVKSRYYEDQDKLVINILKTLPKNCDLYLKEHNAAIGLRDMNFYKKILKYPNVYLLNHEINLKKYLSSFNLIISQAGTVSYEAALENIPSFTFADCFFNKLKNCFKINFEDLKNCKNIKELLNEKILENEKKLSLEAFKIYISKRSFSGNIVGVYGNPDVIKDKNIEVVAREIKKLFYI